MKTQRFWSERYAGYEPGLHQIEHILPKPKLTLRTFEDTGAREDWRLLSSAPLRPVKKANGAK